jgi:peptidyl-prolyl cis-trans isomerase D
MLKQFQNRDNRLLKITMGVILGIISLTMVITLVPGLGSPLSNDNPDAVATVDGQAITEADTHQFFDQATRGQNVPPQMERLYMPQIVNQLVFERALELEARRLGIRVTAQEQADRIKQIIPTAFSDDTWVGKDQYGVLVQERTGMSVADFESQVRATLLDDKFHSILTDGVSVSPEEIELEFRNRNEKVKLDYVSINPADLVSSINPSDPELNAFFAKSASRYQLPERRSARYALLDQSQIQQRAAITDADVQNYYKLHMDEYQVPDRVHVEHILFKTVGKTDAENVEIQKTAEQVLAKAKSGANFEDLARQYSDDSSKDKGGDLGWIVRGQTVPEFEKTAFSLQPGSISGLVKTQYGYHIIKSIEHEPAHVKSLDDVRLSIFSTLSEDKNAQVSDQIFSQITSAVRQSNRQSLDKLAKQFNMQTGETALADTTQPVDDFGSSQDVHDVLFHLRPGEISEPLRVDKGVLILTLKDVQPGHAATLNDVRDKVLKDYREQQSVQLARTKAEDLAARVHKGESLADAAKALGLDVKSTDLFALNAPSVPGLGPVSDIAGAFKMKTGQTSDAKLINTNWIVYTVADHQDPNPADLPAQRAGIEKALLANKQSLIFESFQTALVDRLKREGKITINQEALKRMSSPT